MNKNQEKFIKDLDNFLADPVSGIVKFYRNIDQGPYDISNLSVDLIDEGDKYRALLDIPGVKKNDINIEIVDGNCLKVSATRNRSTSIEGKTYIHKERSTQSFSRQITLPNDIEADSLQASYENGTLDITISKVQKKTNVKKFSVS